MALVEEATISSQEVNSTILVGVADASTATSKTLTEALTSGSTAARVAALQHMIRLHLNGEPQNHMIMTVIKYITPLNNHQIKKLVLYFWEVIDKTDPEGNLLSVIILICSFLRNDLQHPNEFVRVLTLRFLCKLKEKDLLAPLVSAVIQNLSHSLNYVRRIAVLTIHSIYRRFPELLPDAPEIVHSYLQTERGDSALRNAFDFLVAFAPERAAAFLFAYKESGELATAVTQDTGYLLMSVVDFCRQMIRENPYDKAKYVPILFTVLQSRDPSVRYQCACAMPSLSSSKTAVKHATLTFVDILKTHTDNSVRLIVVDQLDHMRNRFLDVLQDSLMDVLSALNSVSLDAKSKIVKLAVELITAKNTDSFVQAMKRELQRVQADSDVDTPAGKDYRLLLIQAIHSALVRFPQSAPSVLPVLLDYVCDGSAVGDEVVCLIKEVLQVHPAIRWATLRRLMDGFPMMTSSSTLRSVLWILGTHVTSVEEIRTVSSVLKDAVGPLPLTPPAAPAKEVGGAAPVMQAMTTVREDGTYVTTISATPTTVASPSDAAEFAGLRVQITKGDYFLATTLASTLTKLVMQLDALHAPCDEARETAVAILDEILCYGLSSVAPSPMDDSAQEHVRLSLSILSNPRGTFIMDVMQEAQQVLTEQATQRAKTEKEARGAGVGRGRQDEEQQQVDAPLVFTQLLGTGADTGYELEAMDDGGSTAKKGRHEESAESYLRRIEDTKPLSGFCDPVYCEAHVEVHQFEVSVDWLLVNRTSHLLTKLTIELTSLGGMKLCERTQVYTLPPHGQLHVRTSLKVSATESGVIYGNVHYTAPNGERCCVILTDIHIDIMNYIKPAVCQGSEFRSKWCIFDWENKIDVFTDKYTLKDYIDLIVRELNMHLMEDYNGADVAMLSELPVADENMGSSEYISCNLFARTVFGDDALANVSVERDAATGMISGVVRIRSNAQTLAFGIGEKLTLLQKIGKV